MVKNVLSLMEIMNLCKDLPVCKECQEWCLHQCQDKAICNQACPLNTHQWFLRWWEDSHQVEWDGPLVWIHPCLTHKWWEWWDKECQDSWKIQEQIKVMANNNNTNNNNRWWVDHNLALIKWMLVLYHPLECRFNNQTLLMRVTMLIWL